MADRLATVGDLDPLPGGATEAQALIHLAAATAVVQEAAGQRIARVLGDTATFIGSTDSWADLPQRPVTAVTAVTLDGDTLTEGTSGSGPLTYRVIGSRLWRGAGWQVRAGEPSVIAVTYDHGYADGDQGIEFARAAVIGLAKRGLTVAVAGGVVSERIDDYQVAYESAASAMDASPYLRRALIRQYGVRAALVRIGG